MWVRGNTLSLGIPLQTKTVEGKTVTTEDYYPPAGSETHVFMANSFKKIEYEHTIEGNVVMFTDDGSLPLGVWGIEITVKEPTPHNYRTFKCQEIEIVECSDFLGDLPDGTILTSPAIFIQGPKGDPFTYEDFTRKQIADLMKPATDAAAEVAELELRIEKSENLRDQAEHDRQLAEQRRVQAESGRVSAELLRVQAENGRVLAEQGRVGAEQYRENTFATYEQTFSDIDSRLDALEGSLYITEEQFNEIFT